MMMSQETIDIIKRLERSFSRMVKNHDYSGAKECASFQVLHGVKGYEIWFVPEIMNYPLCLDKLESDDVVFDVGAGDFRFDLIMAEKVKKVYAVEINPQIVQSALRIIGLDLPENLTVICGNAFNWDSLPPDVTVVTCLMIQRVHEFPQSWRDRRIIYFDYKGMKVLEPVKE